MKNDLNLGAIWQLLGQIVDPEIPVISILDLGMIRNVGIESGSVVVTIAPTFIGCPAIQVIQQDITKELKAVGIVDPVVKISLSPPWSSNWITSKGRRKLMEFGLSPPPLHNREIKDLIPEIAACPYCDSDQTVLTNSFGPTLCRAIYYCNNCNQPFEQFKPM